MVMKDYDSDSILAELLTSRVETELLRTVTKYYDYIKERGKQPHMHMLNNECSSLMKKSIR